MINGNALDFCCDRWLIQSHQGFAAVPVVGLFSSTAGKLKFPVRSTALIEMTSGRELENVRDVWSAGRISVVQTSLFRYCKTHSQTGLPTDVAH